MLSSTRGFSSSVFAPKCKHHSSNKDFQKLGTCNEPPWKFVGNELVISLISSFQISLKDTFDDTLGSTQCPMPKLHLGRVAASQWRFYTLTLLHTDAFTHRRVYTQTLLHTNTLTHKHFCTQKLLHTDACTHTELHTDACTHTDAFTHTQTPLHTNTFTHRHFCTQKLLHTDAFTH